MKFLISALIIAILLVAGCITSQNEGCISDDTEANDAYWQRVCEENMETNCEICDGKNWTGPIMQKTGPVDWEGELVFDTEYCFRVFYGDMNLPENVNNCIDIKEICDSIA